MDKRGQELSLNTLVIIILLVIALVVIAVFFLGGTSSLSKSIRSIFFGTTAGTDLSLAVETCQQRCEQAKSLPTGVQETSAYCKSTFNMDTDNDGNIDIVANCGGGTIGVKCFDNENKEICSGNRDKTPGTG